MDETLFDVIAKALSERDVELVIVDDNGIQALNREYRQKEGPTDVLSFPLEEEFEHLPLGTVVISTDTAEKQAQECGHTFEEEMKILFLHGLLHLLGYNHEVDTGEMGDLEEKYRKEFNLPLGLIKRGS